MFSLRPLLLRGVFRNHAFRLDRIFEAHKWVSQLKGALILKNHFSNKLVYGKGNFSRPVEEDKNFMEEDGEDVSVDKPGLEKSKEEIFQEISKGDESVLQSLKQLEYEIAFIRSIGQRVPDRLTKSQWEELLLEPSLWRRKKVLRFYRLNELKEMSSVKKNRIRREAVMKEREELGFHYYGLSGHYLFQRIYERKFNNLLGLRNHCQEGIKIIFDCSYEDVMTRINLKACAKQLGFSLIESRFNRQCSEIVLCNLSKDGELRNILPRYAPSIFTELIGLEAYEEDYLDLFPKERLVYLTPHTQKDLVFNPNDIFIIGAFVDKGASVKASLTKAKSSEIRYARLPLDKYLSWEKGTKSLPLNIVLKILLEMGFCNDWKRAFQHIPSRSIRK